MSTLIPAAVTPSDPTRTVSVEDSKAAAWASIRCVMCRVKHAWGQQWGARTVVLPRMGPALGRDKLELPLGPPCRDWHLQPGGSWDTHPSCEPAQEQVHKDSKISDSLYCLFSFQQAALCLTLRVL